MRTPNPGKITSTANSAFHFEHGWVANLTSETKTQQKEFLGPNTNFQLFLDGAQQPFVADNTALPNGIFEKLFLTNYPNGMTGTHLFLGQWYIDGGLIGGTPGTAVFQLACALTVEFQ